ncbi:M17 family metallopeptidase [Mycoplasmopsis columbina]|uniref:M17 family metallopeptidase n=1 Tax=Mycoplasmopsis columbina TaxID=114881 RepID=UPI0004A72910|nr:M17 family metallopeptidase [Mycoplasmopsis columbina]VEU77130.1 Probable cytosol aminopeptidase [Mycoplasmopsis columbina]
MLFKNILTEKTNDVVLKAFFKDQEAKKYLVEKNGKVTEYLNENVAYVYLGEKKDLTKEALVSTFKGVLAAQGRTYLVDIASFVSENVNEVAVVEALTRAVYFVKADLYKEKTTCTGCKGYELLPYLTTVTKEVQDAFEKAVVLAEATNFARNLQIMPPNICNSEYLADFVQKDLAQYDNLKVTVLNKAQIEKYGMGLLLSVNRGSVYEPRVVVIEYNGDKDSEEKTVLVGKGITFDSGGYSLKGGRHMLGMKFDMSGSVIVAGALKAIAQLKPKKNFAAVMCITDNRVNGDASLPDTVWKSMNGKTVEINNTDAEGRLVMADGLTYAVRELKATRLIDVATLTGAILSALGHTYTGVWTTTEKAWEDVQAAAKKAGELVWRMPFDEAFAKNIKQSKVADLKNTDLSGNGGSNSAAMFLKEFTEDVEYVHFDVAGTAEISEEPQGVLVHTLAELALN